MYIPKIFEIEKNTELFAFIEQWSFGSLVTSHKGELFINQIPFVLDSSQNKLYGHLAVKNPQLDLLEKADDLTVIFNGVNAYISPSWYVSQEMVPTWNFESVQVSGKARLLDKDDLFTVLEKLTEKYESSFNKPWTMNKLSKPRLNRMIEMITGFEIDIAHIQGKSKLSQNRNMEDRVAVVSGLRAQQDNMSHLVADKIASGLGDK